MLTGDHKDVAENVAKELSIDEFYAELLPQDKVTKLEAIIEKKNKKSKVNSTNNKTNDNNYFCSLVLHRKI